MDEKETSEQEFPMDEEEILPIRGTSKLDILGARSE